MGGEIEFNDDFRGAFSLIENGSNVFITGRAGTGKSTFLDYLVRSTKRKAVLLAPTGVAAVNVGGQTIHSFFALAPGATPEDARREALARESAEIFKALELIVIDEVSMVRADLLDCVDVFLRAILRDERPFGGKQMVFVGDLYQLPPIVKTEEERALFREQYASRYFFDAKVMAGFRYVLVEFGRIYRQSDAEFIGLLNRVRDKTLTEEDVAKINSRLVQESSDEGYIHLVTTNQMAEEINAKKLAGISEKQYAFRARISGSFGKESFPAETLLRLKKGAQVMFLANDSARRWVNGTIGTIIAVNKRLVAARLGSGKTVKVPLHAWEIFRYRYSPASGIAKETIGAFMQYPLRLAWAITIHKSQGKTFERAIIDIGRGTFATGQLYVALSRCTTLGGIRIMTRIQKHHVFTDIKIPEYFARVQPGRDGGPPEGQKNGIQHGA